MDFITKIISGKNINIQKNSYIWNTIAGLLNAGQSVLILMVIARVTNTIDAGIFTIAYASANLFLSIGKYGMRSYQVTDTRNHYSFSDYLGSRVITCIAMMLVSIIYVVYGYFFSQYSVYKSLVIIVICLLKLIDAAEDVFCGLYQQRNRLDIGSRITSIRLMITIVVLCSSLAFSKNLLTASVITVIISGGISIAFNMSVYKSFGIGNIQYNYKKIWRLLIDCFGPFAAGFLSFYVGNAPKYAIDAHLSQEMQAYYGYIAMPVFVIGLLNTFLYQPILTSLAEDWAGHRRKHFIQRVRKQLLIIVGLTVIVLIGAYLLGIPVLSMLYATNLTPYKTELLILLLGGGMLAIVGFITVVLTILRYQLDLLWGYGIISILAFILSPIFVKRWELMGASWIYTILITVLAIIFCGILVFRIYRDNRND